MCKGQGYALYHKIIANLKTNKGSAQLMRHQFQIGLNDALEIPQVLYNGKCRSNAGTFKYHLRRSPTEGTVLITHQKSDSIEGRNSVQTMEGSNQIILAVSGSGL
jgi:hypothetical protein